MSSREISFMDMPPLKRDAPFKDLLRRFFARRPSDVEGLNNTSALYYTRWAWRKVYSRFALTGLPESWDETYFWETLFRTGVISIVDTGAGVLPLRCGYGGINVFDKPTTIVIANHVLGSFDRTIGVDGVLVKLQYDYNGVSDTIDRIAALLAMCDSAISVNLMNSKVTFMGMADSKKQADSMMAMYDMISAGNPAVFVKGDQIKQTDFYFNNAKANFVADLVQNVKRTLINDFLTDLGINNLIAEKKERLIVDEVNSNNAEIRFSIQDWIDNIQRGLDEANAMFGLDLGLEIREYKDELSESDRLFEDK